jgi:hypothetical protein
VRVRGFRRSLLAETEPADAPLVPAEMVGELVAQRLLNLTGEQYAVVSEIALEGVAVDHDPILPPLARNPVAEVLTVCLPLVAEIGDHHCDLFQHPLEFLWERVDGVGDKRLEAVRLGLIHWHHVNQQPVRSTQMRDDQPECASSGRLRAIGRTLAILAIAATGVVWSGCGEGDSDSNVTDRAKQEIEEGTKKAEEAVEEGADKAKKGIEEGRAKAKKGLEEGRAEAEKGLEEAKEEAEKYLP